MIPLSPVQAEGPRAVADAVLEGSREINGSVVDVEVRPGSEVGRSHLAVYPVTPLPAEVDPNISTVFVDLDYWTTTWLISVLLQAQRFHEHERHEEAG
jgi:hypothetical protein